MGLTAICSFAAPVSYNITFTTTTGPAPASGSFTYDSSAPLTSRFTGFTVLWESGVFDLTAAANSGEQFLGTDCGTVASSASVFAILSRQNVCANAAAITWNGGRPGGIVTFRFSDQELAGSGASISVNSSTPYSDGLDASGTFSIASPSAAPEPSTFLLALVPGVFLLRKRMIRGVGRR